MTDEKIRVSPAICSYVDDDHKKLTLEISVPGVKREAIKLRMHDDSFSFSGPRDDFEYAAARAFCCPVKAEAAEAKYENGLLKVEVPFKYPMEDAVSVAVK
jgi:HSP20 family molecular chaperone IbpA